jgi:WD40 repeat protein
MASSLVCARLVYVVAVLYGCRQDPPPSCHTTIEGLQNATRLHIASEKYITVTGYTHGATVIELGSGKVVFRNPILRTIDSIVVTHDAAAKVICGGELFDKRKGLWEGVVWCFDLKTGRELSRKTGLLEEVHRLTSSRSGDKIGILCSTSAPTVFFPERHFVQEVHLWDLKDQSSEVLSRGRYDEFRLSPSADSFVVVDSARDRVKPFGIFQGRRAVVEFGLSSKKEQSRFTIGRYKALCVSDDGKRVAVVADGDRSGIDVWNVAKGEKIATIEKSSLGIVTIAFNKSAELIAYGDGDGNVAIWSLSNKRRLHTFKHKCAIEDLQFTLDDSDVVCLDEQGDLCFFALLERKGSRLNKSKDK